VDSHQRLNPGFKREFFSNLLVQVTASDIFRTASIHNYNSDCVGLVTKGTLTHDNQNVRVSTTFKFGNQKLKRKTRKRSAMEDELKRISG